jgi:hypothetical protein
MSRFKARVTLPRNRSAAHRLGKFSSCFQPATPGFGPRRGSARPVITHPLFPCQRTDNTTRLPYNMAMGKMQIEYSVLNILFIKIRADLDAVLDYFAG